MNDNTTTSNNNAERVRELVAEIRDSAFTSVLLSRRRDRVVLAFESEAQPTATSDELDIIDAAVTAARRHYQAALSELTALTEDGGEQQ